MKMSKRYIPILITFALLSLISLQVIWLYFAYQYKVQELKDKTSAAVLETTKKLQQEENTKIIAKNIDSLIVTDNIHGEYPREDVRKIIFNIKHKLKNDTLDIDTKIKKELSIISDTTSSTTIVKIGNNKEHKVIIRSESRYNGRSKNKAKELESLFLKMAVNAENESRNIDSRVDSLKVLTILKNELLKRGIDLNPEVGVVYFPKNNRSKTIGYHYLFNTPKYKYILPAMVTLPLFPNDIFGGDLYIKVGYHSSTSNFIIKQMTGLLALSLSITVLIGFVMIYIFKRMLSQQKLHQLKNDFINNMTHELKTPIATISLAIDSISNPIIKDNYIKFNEYTNIIRDENKKLDQHVERVLQMALLEKRDMELEKKRIDLKETIFASIKANQLKARSKEAELDFTTNNDEAFITGNQFSILNVFNNLIDNSLKYSKPNCKIKIDLKKENTFFVITVSDTGIGIDKKELHAIFDKFYRVQRGNLHDVKGSGLGLSYVRSIIERHHGSIEVISELNKGTTFTIKFIANEI